MMRKYHVRFGGGPMEKVRDRNLASGLPNYAWLVLLQMTCQGITCAFILVRQG